MKLSKPPAAGSAEAGAGGDSVVFFFYRSCGLAEDLCYHVKEKQKEVSKLC